jgi:Ca2+-binding EF-hand superfamily protein
MKFKLILLAMGTAAAAATAAAQDGSALFDRMDLDRDGRVTAREHSLSVRTMFAAMDANRDGRVTATEMDAAQSQVGNRRADALSSAEKIRAVDRNGDGLLTIGEHVSGAKAMFARMDANRDGHLDRGEHHAGHAVLAKK